MTTNTLFVIAGAVVLGVCAVAAIEIAKRWKRPRCPVCHSRNVHEWRGENFCETCDERWSVSE